MIKLVFNSIGFHVMLTLILSVIMQLFFFLTRFILSAISIVALIMFPFCAILQTLLRIWDCFFVEGPKVLFRFALGLLKMHEKQLLQQLDTISVMRHLKCCAKLTFDVEGLVKVSRPLDNSLIRMDRNFYSKWSL